MLGYIHTVSHDVARTATATLVAIVARTARYSNLGRQDIPLLCRGVVALPHLYIDTIGSICIEGIKGILLVDLTQERIGTILIVDKFPQTTNVVVPFPCLHIGTIGCLAIGQVKSLAAVGCLDGVVTIIATSNLELLVVAVTIGPQVYIGTIVSTSVCHIKANGIVGRAGDAEHALGHRHIHLTGT